MSMVELTVADGVAEVTLNAPKKMNSLDEQALADLSAAYAEAGAKAEEGTVRALLLRGEGVSPGTAIDAASPGDATVQSPQSGAAEHDDAPETSVDPVHDTSLASEIALAAAYRMVATSHAPESRLIKLLEILDHSVFHAAAGERILGELTQRAATVGHGEVLEALRIGSAVPCYEAPLRAGAVLGGAPTAHVNALADTGRALGMAHGLARELRLAGHTDRGHGARELLRAVPELTVKEIKDASICCGSAGIYNVLNPEPAKQLGDAKAANVIATGAQLLVTANPGCIMQIAQGVERAGGRIGTAHIVTVLDHSQRGLPADGLLK